MEDALDWARGMLPEDRIDLETVHGWALDELLDRSVGAGLDLKEQGRMKLRHMDIQNLTVSTANMRAKGRSGARGDLVPLIVHANGLRLGR